MCLQPPERSKTLEFRCRFNRYLFKSITFECNYNWGSHFPGRTSVTWSLWCVVVGWIVYTSWRHTSWDPWTPPFNAFPLVWHHIIHIWWLDVIVYFLQIFVKFVQNCEIWYSHSSAVEDSSLLGSDDVTLGEWFLVFWRIIVLSSSGSTNLFELLDDPVLCGRRLESSCAELL